MTVPTIASVVSGAIERSLGTSANNSIAKSVKSLLTSSGSTSVLPTDVSQLSAATSMQAQVAGLRSASLNLAQTSSLVNTADSGASDIGRVLDRLQDLAARAAGAVDEPTRRALDVEFQSLRSQINRTIANIHFNGRALLDGSIKASDLGLETDDPNAGIPDLRDEALFEGKSLSIASEQGAKAAIEAVKKAQAEVEAARADMSAFNEALEIASATVESALQNQVASRSVLDDNVTLDELLGVQAQVGNQPVLSLLAQTNNLPANIVQLLAE